MKQASLFSIVLLVAGFSPTVKAQMRMGPPAFHGVWAPEVGKGAIYDVQSSDGTKRTMEVSVVGKETVEGKDAYWMQMAFPSPEAGGEMVMKTLAVVTAGDVVTTRFIMQMPGRPPMEMSKQMMTHGANSHADVRSDGQDLGTESITVPAGTFTCEHYRTKDGGDVWAAKVPPWGLVKYQGKDSSMVLTKVLADAKDKIVGKPQPFNPMMMMQQPSQ